MTTRLKQNPLHLAVQKPAFDIHMPKSVEAQADPLTPILKPWHNHSEQQYPESSLNDNMPKPKPLNPHPKPLCIDHLDPKY